MARARRTWRERSLAEKPLAGPGKGVPKQVETTTPRRQPRHDYEGSEQKALISWLHGEWRRGSAVGQAYPVTYHPPNGGQRNKRTASELKAQGVKAGVSDLVIAAPRGGHHGLYLEFKATPPRHASMSASQREWLAEMERQGYCAVLARGLEEARAVLREYMALPPTQVAGAAASVASGTEWRR